MKRLAALSVALLMGLLVATGLQTVPALTGAAHAATNCNTLPNRIKTHNQDAQNYNAQVQALNARGGGSAGQKAYYDNWRSRGSARVQSLRAELQRCHSQGKLQNITAPQAPGGSAPAPRAVPRAPRQAPNLTPGFARPSTYGAAAGVVSDSTTPANGRLVKFRGGGRIDLAGLRGGRPASVTTSVSVVMINKGSNAKRVTPRGLGGRHPIRGQLLAAFLGGPDDARNSVALTPKANARLIGIERRVQKAVQRSGRGKVSYMVSPSYGAGVLGGFGNAVRPTELHVIARGCGLNIGLTIPNK